MKLNTIQALRGFAALCVAMTHLVSFEREAIRENGFSEQSLSGGLWENGFAGVDLFFVISGFIMVYVTAGRERTVRGAGDFIFARAARVYPLWWLFAVIMAIIFLYVHGTPFHPIEYNKTDAGPVAYILKSVLLLPQEGLPVLGVGWTLIHEVYFYLVFGLFLLLPERHLPLLLALWFVTVLGAFVAGFTSTYPGTLLHVATYPMTVEFILGAFAGLALLNFKPKFCLSLTLLSAIAFVAAMVLFKNTTAEENGIWITLKWGRVIFFGLPAAVLVYAITQLEKEGQIQIPRFAVKLGDISYAFYLCHTIVFILVKRAFSEFSNALSGAGVPDSISNMFLVGSAGVLDNLLFALCCLSVSILVAKISFDVFERPSLLALSKFRRQMFSASAGR